MLLYSVAYILLAVSWVAVIFLQEWAGQIVGTPLAASASDKDALIEDVCIEGFLAREGSMPEADAASGVPTIIGSMEDACKKDCSRSIPE